MNTRPDRHFAIRLKCLHETGEKEKVTNCEIENLASEFENIPVMSQAKALSKVKYYEKIATEINELIDMNDLDEMKDNELTDLLRNLQEKYEVLEDMSNEDYNNKSLKHDDMVAKVKQNIRNAKSARIRVKELKGTYSDRRKRKGRKDQKSKGGQNG